MPTPAPIDVTRHPVRFEANDRRVIPRFFAVGGDTRMHRILERVHSLSDARVEALLAEVYDDFRPRHRRIELAFDRHLGYLLPKVPQLAELPENRRRLIGSYFTMEYTIESAALFNPSIVPHPDQSGTPDGDLRFIMSLRATGEGHVSSIVFRTGTVTANGAVDFDRSSQYVAKMRVDPDKKLDKHLFFLKLIEMGAYSDAARVVLEELPDTFTFEQLDGKTHEVKHRPGSPRPFDDAARNMRWLARSNYTLRIPEDAEPDEIVVFPTSENESRGIEDARLTRFTEDDGTVTYYGTYTAYNGFKILPQMFETQDFKTIAVHTLNGKHVQNKGMALFPRKIDGFYRMVSRLDGENMFMMKSDNPYFWNEAQTLCEPVFPWEFVQVGNCGPPIETEHGWLLLTHGVGPVRQYCIGAVLLDLEDPTRVIGQLDQPLLVPQENERNGYVPNVVYTCGALAHGDTLVMPYAVSDSATTVATLSLGELLEHLTNRSKTCPLPDRRVSQRA